VSEIKNCYKAFL